MKDLVGQGKPLYSSLDKAAGMLKRKVGTGSEFLKELMAIPGVKQTEVSERGLGELLNAPKMTHEQFLAALQSKPVPAIKEKVLGEPVQDKKLRDKAWEQAHEDAIDEYLNAGHTYEQARRGAPEVADRNINRYLPEGSKEYATHHSEWTIPGGENYREMLIKMPRKSGDVTKEVFPGNPQHFGGEPGIVASLRLKDRTGPNGEKLLHLEELQSDWHQTGRDKGYKTGQEQSQIKDLANQYDALVRQREDLINREQPDLSKANDITPKLMELQEKMDTLRSASKMGVPDAPFKKNWEEMALKRLIHHAAEKGYHGIVVTPGQEQADRYDLSKHVDQLMYQKNPDGTYQLSAQAGGRGHMIGDSLKEDELEHHVGKEVAQKIAKGHGEEQNLGGSSVSRPPDIWKTMSGLDLKVGGEGMKGFYDKKVPNILNSIGKKHGVKTQLQGMSTANPKTGQSITDMLKAEGLSENDWQDLTSDQRMAMVDRHDQRSKQNVAQLHYFPITDQMRQDVLKNGLPLYKEGGQVHVSPAKATMDRMKYELANRKG